VRKGGEGTGKEVGERCWLSDAHAATACCHRSNPAREAFVEMCKSDYVQRMTFDSYLYKTVVPGTPIEDVKLLVETVGSILRASALRTGAGPSVSFGSREEPAKASA
jgi:geranylgeranyl diphosphate/geranylgeranyl-bacteriochlorophyllide a reductase